MTAQSISHYKILEKLGEGGMGVVYHALDTHLDRTVAIKLLRPEAVGDPEHKWRFVREAKAASALNHPNIVTIHDIDTADGVDFIAMEWVDGQSLDHRIGGHGLPVWEALSYALQTADALAAAHSAGIVHRDIKPANIMVTPAGRIKVLDFGLAKLIERGGAEEGDADSLSPTVTGEPRTRGGVILGTLAYMSPEQAGGKPVDSRSDVFSFGSALYEMLSGHRAFQGDSQILTITAILRDPPAPLKNWRSDVPADLERVLLRCLEKRPEDRYPSAAEMHDDLVACQARRAAPALRVPSAARRPGVVVGLGLVLVTILAALAWYFVRESRIRRARQALPEIARLIEKVKPAEAFRLARETERYLPEDVERLRRNVWIPVLVTTEPAGADVFVKDYLGVDSPWQSLGRSPVAPVKLPLGRSPVAPVRLPLGNFRWRIAKEGFQTIETVSLNWPLAFRLDPPGAVPPGMVHVPGGRFQYRSAQPVELGDYWLDKYEVTNKQFKEFVDRGGYQKRDYWKEPFVKDGRTLSWEEAMGQFKDTTGRAGPSTWELGTYPDGRADYPVNGVSWYEAAAYAESAGKSLPTIYNWYNAAGVGIFSDILRLSNFGGKGPAPVGSHQGLTSWGAYDMAGNVKEWCWNATGDHRYILGGAWSDPGYMFSQADAQPPFDRSATNGFRCVKYAAPVTGEQAAPVERLTRDYSRETPAPDEAFRIYRGFYAYDRTPLNAAIESVDESSPYWRKEKVVFEAAYGRERVPAYLFLPRNAAPPYQTVVYFPSLTARVLPSSQDLEMRVLDFVIRSGRALLHPVYKGTYERRSGALEGGPNEERDLVIQWSKDLGRSLDYLETRQDIDRGKFAYYGLSLGAITALPLVAVEDRFKAAVLLAGGLPFNRTPPEIEPINFARRIRIPVLLMGGRQDFVHPVDSAQIPLFRLLGTPEKDKRHIIFEGGHAPLRIQILIKDILDWFDRYLGPVKTRA